MSYDPFAPNEEETNLAFDLRIFYATVIGRKIIRIQDFTEKNNFMGWYEEMTSMFPLIYSRVKGKDLQESSIKDYKEARINTLRIINKYSDVYLGKKHDAEASATIKESLLALQFIIFRVLEESNQFGNLKNIRGLN